MNRREMSVGGSFYPRSCEEVEHYLEVFNTKSPVNVKKVKARAMISPHAGYIYSGFTANMAYRTLDASQIKRVVVIGPSHRVYLKGASVALFDSYASPCQEMKIDLDYSKALVQKHDILSFDNSAHQEHSTETQIPFIEHYFNAVELVEIVYGDLRYTDLIPIINEILEDEENFLVISTDLSHFHDLKKANTLDGICSKAVKNMDLSLFDKGCEACGMIGVKAMIHVAKDRGLNTELMDYRTSFDTSSDASSVVGYLSALVG